MAVTFDGTQRLPEPTTEDIDLVTVLAALADPWRLAAVRRIAGMAEPVCCGDLHDDVASIGHLVGKSTASHHMRVLRESGVTHAFVLGARRFMVLRREDLEARFPGLIDSVLRAE